MLNVKEGFNDKEVFLLIYVSLLLVKPPPEGEFAKDTKVLFVEKFHHGMRCSAPRIKS